MPAIGKTTNAEGKRVFFKQLPNGQRMELKKTKDGFKDVGLLPDKTDVEKKLDKLGLQIKAAEIRGDEEKKAELEKKKAELEELK